jgi:phage terminase large subunit
MQTELTIPEKLGPLFEPRRYKVLYGGRGSAKSWTVARILLAIGATRCVRVLCCREIQKSIAESVHQLLRDQIEKLGLGHHYTVTDKAITGANGTQFFFAGLKHNIDSIKSKEGIDLVWVEEAQTVSKRSWEKLIPTIRKPGSEIWVVFNPELDTDETWKRFIIQGADDPRVLKILMNWRDNKWFTGELEEERIKLRAERSRRLSHRLRGPLQADARGRDLRQGAARAAQAEGRITTSPTTARMPVFTAWDLGLPRPHEHLVHAAHRHPATASSISARRSAPRSRIGSSCCSSAAIVYDTHFLPHDGDNESMASQLDRAAHAQREP